MKSGTFRCCTVRYEARKVRLLICGNKMPTRCNRGFYCRSYCLPKMFQAPLCLSSGAQEYYTVVSACGISCCGFQVVGLVWSWGLCVRFAGCRPRGNVPDFGRMFLKLKYADFTKNTYIQSWTVTEIMAIEKCGLLACPRTVRCPLLVHCACPATRHH